MTLISTPVVVDLTVSAPTIVVDIVTTSGPAGPAGPAGSGVVVVRSTPPPDPVEGLQWWQPTGAGTLWLWYEDPDSGQWVEVAGGGGGSSSGGGGIEEAPIDGLQYARSDAAWEVVTGGGGGGGVEEAPTDGQQYARQDGDWEVVSLADVPVAPIGSTVERSMGEWLAGAPVVEITGSEVVINANHRGVWLHMMNAIASMIWLPDDWAVGQTFGARQVGTGVVTWTIVGGDATVQLPFTRNTHTGISEQYEEIIFRVVANSDGAHAVWGIAGATG